MGKSSNWNSYRYNWRLGMDKDGKLVLEYYEVLDSGTTSRTVSIDGTNVMNDKWHHLATTYNAETKTLTVFLDHRSVVTRTLTGMLLNEKLIDGAYGNCGPAFGGYCCDLLGFSGYIDEVRVASRVLSTDEMLYMHSVLGMLMIVR